MITGADRIAANGDTANKIGTYGVAVLAAAHDIPFYVAAPSQHLRSVAAGGDAIPIEQRDPREDHARLRPADGPRRRPRLQSGLRRHSRRLIPAIICERGVIQPVGVEQIAAMVGPAKPTGCNPWA